MGRPERPLDPDGGPVVKLAIALRELRCAAGGPSYRAMAQRAHRSQTALSEAAGGVQLPTWDTVEAYVRACDGDPTDWRGRWDEAAKTSDLAAADADEPSPVVADAESESEELAHPQGRRLRHPRLVAAGALGLVVIGVGGVMVFINQPSSIRIVPVVSAPSTAARSQIADGADPKDSGCALDPAVVTLDSAEVDFNGQPAGLDELRYSPHCGMAWARFESFPKAQIPAGIVIHVDVVRPDDHNLRFPFQAKYVGAPVYGNVALSTAKCVFAASWIEASGKRVPESKTHCFRGKTMEQTTQSNG
jgi:hypothetical protein